MGTSRITGEPLVRPVLVGRRGSPATIIGGPPEFPRWVELVKFDGYLRPIAEQT